MIKNGNSCVAIATQNTHSIVRPRVVGGIQLHVLYGIYAGLKGYANDIQFMLFMFGRTKHNNCRRRESSD